MSSDSKSGAACAKARAMYGMRLTREDFDELIASYSLDGIYEILSAHPLYGETMRGVAGAGIRRRELESLIRHGIDADYKKLLYYMADRDKEPLRLYMRKGEVEYILRVIFALKNKSGGDSAAEMPQVMHIFDDGHDEEMSVIAQASSFADLLEKLKSTKYGGVLDGFDIEHSNTVELETLLYNRYMQGLIKEISTDRPREESAELRRQLGMRIDIENIRRFVRMKRYFPDMLGSRFALDFGYRIGEDEIRALVAGDDPLRYLEAVMPLYAKYYGMAQQTTAYSSKDRISIQIDRGILRMSGSALATAMSYFGIKTVEVKNLYHIIEGIRYERPESEMRSMLIGISDDDNNNQ